MDVLARRLKDAETAVRAAADEMREQARRLTPLGVREIVDALEARASDLLETATLISENRDRRNQQ